ncbi:hypothetical protein S2M10_33390 [Sphingomonas sp. S2M10]|nr:hypothetical protein [Sphingomonas sp. S2M10]
MPGKGMGLIRVSSPAVSARHRKHPSLSEKPAPTAF